MWRRAGLGVETRRFGGWGGAWHDSQGVALGCHILPRWGRDGGHECALKERRIPAQGATLGIGWWACIRDTDGGYAFVTRMAGMHPGHGRWACIRNTDGGYGGAPVWWLGRAGLGRGSVRHMNPRALPWAGMRCPVGAGNAQGLWFAAAARRSGGCWCWCPAPAAPSSRTSCRRTSPAPCGSPRSRGRGPLVIRPRPCRRWRPCSCRWCPGR